MEKKLFLIEVVEVVKKNVYKPFKKFIVKAESSDEAEKKFRALCKSERAQGEPIMLKRQRILVEPIEFEIDGICEI